MMLFEHQLIVLAEHHARQALAFHHRHRNTFQLGVIDTATVSQHPYERLVDHFKLHTSHGNCTKLSLPISLIGQLDDYPALSEDSAELLHPEAGSEVLSKALKCLEQVSCGTELDGAKSAADKSEPGVTAFRGEIWLDTETARAARLLAGELRSKLEHVRSLQQSVQAELSALYSEECEPVSRNASFTEASTTLQ